MAAMVDCYGCLGCLQEKGGRKAVRFTRMHPRNGVYLSGEK